MYSIEYFKTKHKKPELNELECNSNSKMYNFRMRRRYLHQKDLIDKCWNIKSITIDLDDIKKVIFDDNCRNLLFLYARINSIDTSNVSAITILNNNLSNKLCIYEILNCDWMINRNECGQNYDDTIIEKVKELHRLIDNYENSKDQHSKVKLMNRIKLFMHYINSINSLTTENTNNAKLLRLGTKFKRTK